MFKLLCWFYLFPISKTTKAWCVQVVYFFFYTRRVCLGPVFYIFFIYIYESGQKICLHNNPVLQATKAPKQGKKDPVKLSGAADLHSQIYIEYFLDNVIFCSFSSNVSQPNLSIVRLFSWCAGFSHCIYVNELEIKDIWI